VRIDYPDTAFKLDDKPEWIKQRLDTWHGIYGPLFDYRKKFPDRSPEAVKDFAAMTRAYWGTIQSVDDSVGRLYEKLKQMGELDNTVFIFMGDNGLLNGEHGMVDKRTMHEASIRVPLIVRYPRWGRPGHFGQLTIDEQVLTIDVAPTLLETCSAPALSGIHGKSMIPLVHADSSSKWRTSWCYEYNYEKQFPYTPNVRGVRTDDFKYIHYPHDAAGTPDKHKAELYDLKNDPEERRNLIDDPKYAGKVAELKTELARLMSEAGGLPDKMPVDEGIKANLPDAKIR
jgi:N-acetylglucosamine-6-sulfatase